MTIIALNLIIFSMLNALKSYPKGVTEVERKQGMELLRSRMKKARVARKVVVNRNKKGSNSRLMDKQRAELKKILDNGATSYGFPTDPLTLKGEVRTKL